MAEGWARRLATEDTSVYSAGSEPGGLHPAAVAVMSEVGIDLSGHHAKPIAEIPLEEVRTVVTLCAGEVCPALPGVLERHHWPVPDPAGRGSATDDDTLEKFREVRDQIERLLRDFLPR